MASPFTTNNVKGAKVNGVMPYSFHKNDNVVGTKEIVRLATTTKVKPIHYVSTIGVVSQNHAEDDDLDVELLPMLPGYS